MVKTCSKCKVEKDVTEFYKDKTRKYGVHSQCKLCCKEYLKEYYKDNKEKLKQGKKEYNKKRYETNKEKIKEQHKEYRKNSKEKIKEYNKIYDKVNKEKLKEYRKANKDKLKEYSKEWRKSNREKINKYHKERRLSYPLYKMACNLRTRTYQAFKNKGYSKNTKTQEMLGVDWEIAKMHIERQFTEGMSWDNYGEWHIDHIIPLASENTQERLKQLCHYTNLQPMWAIDNVIKSSSIDGQQTMMRL